MIEVIDEWSHGDVVAVRVSGKLLHDDYATLVPRLEATIAEHGAVRCLIELTGLAGIEPRAVWDELRFDLTHAADVRRCAVIGDRRWQKWATQASGLVFRRAELRFFSPEERDQAAEWVHQDTDDGP